MKYLETAPGRESGAQGGVSFLGDECCNFVRPQFAAIYDRYTHRVVMAAA
jgi:hypothetical protein